MRGQGGTRGLAVLPDPADAAAAPHPAGAAALARTVGARDPVIRLQQAYLPAWKSQGDGAV